MRVKSSWILLIFAFLSAGCTALKSYFQCPGDMVYVHDETKGVAICLDKFEHTVLSDRGADLEQSKPHGYRNYFDCERLCDGLGKRLPTNDEWLLACEGTDPSQCNRTRPHPLLALAAHSWSRLGTNCAKSPNMWSVPCMNDPQINELPNGLARNGDFPHCVSRFGAHHMIGNLGEWVKDTHVRKNTVLGRFNGGLYPQPKSSCAYTTVAHGPNYRDYSIGCRCAKKPAFG